MEIEVPKEHVDENKTMFQLTRWVNEDLNIGAIFPDLDWDTKKIEVTIKDLNP